MATNPKFDAHLEKMRKIHEAKNHDYAKDTNPYSNFEETARFAGVTVDQVFRVMIGTKLSRLNELLAAGKEPNNESIQDTRDDLSVYACLYASYHS